MPKNELFWAYALSITLASLLGTVAYIYQRPENTTAAMYRLAEALITGALGFFAGRASALFAKDKDGGDPK